MIRKQDILKYDKPAKENNKYNVERNVVEGILKDRNELMDTQLMKMNGIKTKVTYFRQRTIKGNDYVTSADYFNNIDANTLSYDEITDFYLLVEDEFDVTLEMSEEGHDLTREASGKILPNTIKPLPNDLFILTYDNVDILYRITEVEALSMEEDAAYGITFVLRENYYDYRKQHNPLRESVVDRFVFVYENIGTQRRTLFKRSEFKTIEELENIYSNLSRMYNELYYYKDLGTYVLDFKFTDPITINDGIKTVYRNPSASGFKLSRFYDNALNTFIKEFGLFNFSDNRIYSNRVYEKTQDGEYFRTVFKAIEERDIKYAKYFYASPVHETFYDSYRVLPIYNDTVRIHHAGILLDSGFNLFTKDFIGRFNTYDSNFDYPQGINEDNVVGYLNKIISFFCNTNDEKNTYLIENGILTKLNERTINLYMYDMDRVHLFYMIPMLGYILKYLLTYLHSKAIL